MALPRGGAYGRLFMDWVVGPRISVRTLFLRFSRCLVSEERGPVQGGSPLPCSVSVKDETPERDCGSLGPQDSIAPTPGAGHVGAGSRPSRPLCSVGPWAAPPPCPL